MRASSSGLTSRVTAVRSALHHRVSVQRLVDLAVERVGDELQPRPRPRRRPRVDHLRIQEHQPVPVHPEARAPLAHRVEVAHRHRELSLRVARRRRQHHQREHVALDAEAPGAPTVHWSRARCYRRAP